MSLLSIGGGLIGGLIAGPGGAAVGATVGGAAGGGGGAGVQNPGGPAAFARWANEGHFDWVRSVALNMSGPNWQLDPNDTGQPWKTGYSPADAASAAAILAQHNQPLYGAPASPTATTYPSPAVPGPTSSTAAQLVSGVAGSPPLADTTVGQILQALAGTATNITQSQAQAKASVANTSLLLFGGVALVAVVIVWAVARR